MNQIYLLQSGAIRRPLGNYRNMRLSEAVDMSYMGSAEFEFGALPKSLRAIEAKFDQYRLVKSDKFMQGEAQLRIFTDLQGAALERYLVDLKEVQQGGRRLKEMTNFVLSRMKSCDKSDFWWDIQNHTMFSYCKIFMNNIDKNLTASFDYMNSR